MGPLLFPKGTVNEKTNNKNYPCISVYSFVTIEFFWRNA